MRRLPRNADPGGLRTAEQRPLLTRPVLTIGEPRTTRGEAARRRLVLQRYLGGLGR